jgi:hypothetical protein
VSAGVGFVFSSTPARLNMRILLWTSPPKDFLEVGIEFCTHGPAHHAGFLRKNGMVHELYPPQLRDRAISDDEKKIVQVFSLAGLPPELEAKFERLFDLDLEAGLKYSNEDLIRFLFNQEIPFDLSGYCSWYVMRCISMCAPMCLPLVRCDIGQVSPRDLYISPKLLEVGWDGDNTP